MFRNNLPGDWFQMAVFGCRSLVLVIINNQVLNIIKIAVKKICLERGINMTKIWWTYEVINVLYNYAAYIKNYPSNSLPCNTKSVICGDGKNPCHSRIMAFSNKRLLLLFSWERGFSTMCICMHALTIRGWYLSRLCSSNAGLHNIDTISGE